MQLPLHETNDQNVKIRATVPNPKISSELIYDLIFMAQRQ